MLKSVEKTGWRVKDWKEKDFVTIPYLLPTGVDSGRVLDVQCTQCGHRLRARSYTRIWKHWFNHALPASNSSTIKYKKE